LCRWGGMLVLASVIAVLWRLPNWPSLNPRPALTAPSGDWEAWRPLLIGVEWARASFDYPRPMRALAVRLDLEQPGLEFKVLRRPEMTQAGGMTLAEASRLMRRASFPMALQVGHFVPRTGVQIQVAGCAVTDGEKWANGEDRWGTWVIPVDGKVRWAPPMSDLGDAWQAFPARETVVRDGQNVGDSLEAGALTACGLTKDRRHLVFLVVDGKQPGRTEGATPRDAGQMLVALGVREATLLDLGYSASFVMDRGLWRNPVLNHPDHPWVHGVQRPAAMVLGVRAPQLE
jgi:hypothetical protein